MAATIVDGRAIARKIQSDLQSEISEMEVKPRLDIIIVGSDPVTASFVRVKEKFAKALDIQFVKHELPESAETGEIQALIREVSTVTNGIVVQLPLPEHVNTAAVLSAIPFKQDVDVLNEQTFGRFVVKNTPFVPPVAGAVQEILATHKIPLNMTKAVVIGRGRLVGAPVRTMLEHENADITIIDSKSAANIYREALKSAEIVVSGVGVPNLVKQEHISKGVVLIDAGTSSSGGSIMGDICTDCIQDASLVSKTPGGVGPITVAVLFRNLVLATKS